MIKNQKQASAARERLIELNKSLAELTEKKDELSSAEFTIGYNSLQYLIDDLINDIKEYDSLTEGNFNYSYLNDLGDLNKILISARIAQRISQRELAEILNIQEQQIQRYEANDYESATWTRIQEVALALNLKFNFRPVLLNSTKHFFQIPKGIHSESILKAKSQLLKRGCLNYIAA